MNSEPQTVAGELAWGQCSCRQDVGLGDLSGGEGKYQEGSVKGEAEEGGVEAAGACGSTLVGGKGQDVRDFSTCGLGFPMD